MYIGFTRVLLSSLLLHGVVILYAIQPSTEEEVQSPATAVRISAISRAIEKKAEKTAPKKTSSKEKEVKPTPVAKKQVSKKKAIEKPVRQKTESKKPVTKKKVEPTQASTSPPQESPTEKSEKKVQQLAEQSAKAVAAAQRRAQQATVRYESLLAAHIRSHAYYPRRARSRNITGSGSVRIRLDASGKVIHKELQDTSGSTLLDSAILETVKRAEPLPTFPETITAKQLDFVIPIAFELRK